MCSKLRNLHAVNHKINIPCTFFLEGDPKNGCFSNNVDQDSILVRMEYCKAGLVFVVGLFVLYVPVNNFSVMSGRAFLV